MQRWIRFSAGLAAIAGCAVALGSVGSAQAAVPVLSGSVGPDFTISLKDGKGKPVKALKSGRYTISIRDQASIHDFRLSGPGFDKVITTIGFVGSKRITVTLRKGTYTYVCDPHAGIMHGSFRVR